ncbi:MAG: hypothetical protein QOJ32_1592 [Frankiaceae bacterium]|nr:hypothetical protein [Frankiaceae bacterium]
MPNTAASALPFTTLPAPGTYQVEPEQTSIRFKARHMFGLGGVRGTFACAGGEIRVGDDPALSTVTATIDTASFASGHVRRDGDVKGPHFLDTENNPVIEFSATKLEFADDRAVLSGALTFAGTTAPVELAVDRVSVSEGEISAHATAKVDRYALGVTGAKGIAGRHLTFDIDLTASRETERGA